MAARIAVSLIESSESPPYARWLSRHWREDVTAVARRQTAWSEGYRDWKLLQRPMYWQRSNGEWLLLFGEPALLLTAQSVEQTYSVQSFERAAIRQFQLAQSAEARDFIADEMRVCTLLLAAFVQLEQLNGSYSPPQLRYLPPRAVGAISLERRA